jgi:RND family efflux transporter MFP subunit
VPESTLLKYQEYAWKHNHQTLRDIRIPCSVQLEGETDFPFKGVIDFVDNSVDPDTGTIQMRGVFPNPREYPAAGLFARMRIEGGEPYPALLVPDEAVQTLQDERFLLVVDSTGTVQTKRIQLGALFGDMRVITDGITPQDRVVVNGLQMARPGTKVNVMEAPAPQATPADAASTGTNP